MVLADKENYQKETRIVHKLKRINPQGRPNDMIRLYMYTQKNRSSNYMKQELIEPREK